MKQVNLNVYASQGKELYNLMEDFLNKYRNKTAYDDKQYREYTTKRGNFMQLRQKGFRELY